MVKTLAPKVASKHSISSRSISSIGPSLALASLKFQRLRLFEDPATVPAETPDALLYDLHRLSSCLPPLPALWLSNQLPHSWLSYPLLLLLHHLYLKFNFKMIYSW